MRKNIARYRQWRNALLRRTAAGKGDHRYPVDLIEYENRDPDSTVFKIEFSRKEQRDRDFLILGVAQIIDKLNESLDDPGKFYAAEATYGRSFKEAFATQYTLRHGILSNRYDFETLQYFWENIQDEEAEYDTARIGKLLRPGVITREWEKLGKYRNPKRIAAEIRNKKEFLNQYVSNPTLITEEDRKKAQFYLNIWNDLRSIPRVKGRSLTLYYLHIKKKLPLPAFYDNIAKDPVGMEILSCRNAETISLLNSDPICPV